MATAQLISTATFDGQEITAERAGDRIAIKGYGRLFHNMDEDGAAFWAELRLLEKATGWKPTFYSLGGDLTAKLDDAHAFVAVNLQQLGCIHRQFDPKEKVRFFNPQETAPELLRLLSRSTPLEPGTQSLAAALSSFQGGGR